MITCEQCRYWKVLSTDSETPEGFCRRHAPRPQMARSLAYWPLVKADDGCGDGRDRHDPVLGTTP